MASGNVAGLAPIFASMIGVGIAVHFIFFRSRKKEDIDDDPTSSPPAAAADEGSTASGGAPIFLPHGYEFEVFISFKGSDTRNTFTDHLYEDLIEKGVGAFRDEEGLRRGEEINSNLLEAIKKSKIYIPIFSKGYAESKWCLREVAQMVDCMRKTKQTILPIFYDVTPHDVRHQSSKEYSEAFSSHKKKYPKEVKEWRDALEAVGQMKGWDLTIPANSSQGKIAKIVAFDIRNRLKKPLDLVDKLTGIDDHVVKIMDMLDVNAQDVRVVGLWGSGGVGKTTVAKFIYNELMHQFDSCSFLPDVRVKSQQPDGLESLQKQLLSNISSIRSMEKISNADDGMYTLKNRSTTKVLILVDDVDHKNQLEKLVPNLNRFDPGSRIIVTTRYRRVLEGCNVDKIHEVSELNENDALELFCKHAFKEGFPVNDYFDLSLDIAKATGGLPLSIEVIGSYLSTESDKEIWQEALHKLREDQQILSRLRISYDALNTDGKEMFLDIACLYSGKDSRISSLMWQACGVSTVKSSMKELLQRCLVKIGDDHELWMHDHLQNLGREIVRSDGVSELGRRTRLWLKDDVLTVLENREGTSAVKAIRLDNAGLESEEYIICDDMLKGLSNLQFLELLGAKLGDNFKGGLSKLLWLGWNGCNNLTMPSTVEKLIILDLSKSNNVREDWSGWNSLQVAKKLQVVNLASCPQLTRTPDFSSFQHMKRLILQGCSGLVEIGPSVEHLKELVFLDLRNCISLKKLPNKLGSLVALVDLLIDGTAIEELPTLIGLSKLETLSAKSCTSLQSIPPSVGSLAALKRLWLDNCRSIVEIPSEIGDLESLQELSLQGTKVANLLNSNRFPSNLQVLNINQCPIQRLPQSLWESEKLVEINASKCRDLSGDIPAELGRLKRLRILRLDGTKVTSIPESIIELSNLQTLDLEECQQLRSLPKLPSSITKVLSPKDIPNLPDLISLRQLEIVPCSRHSYDVYLSFCSSDTQSFIFNLIDTLQSSGLRVFKSTEELGDEFGPGDEKLLKQSIISIPVISINYASSERRLKELAQMVTYLKTEKQILLPIFHGIEPRDLRRLTGNFGDAFSKFTEKYNPDTIEVWKTALKRVAALRAWVAGFASRVELHADIARASVVHKKDFIADGYLVGMEEQTMSMMSLLSVEENDVRVVGVHGVGGIGKTTLTKIIYDQLKGKFSCCSFLRDIARTAEESKGLEHLRRQLVYDISKHKFRSHEEFVVDQGKPNSLRSIFVDKKVLVVLDDVNSIEQLGYLVGDIKSFGPGSRIIVTTRRLDILNEYPVKLIHSVHGLPQDTALRLFCNHAFGEDSPPRDHVLTDHDELTDLSQDDDKLAHLSLEVANTLGGIPISIETVASYLSFLHKYSTWKDIITSLHSCSSINEQLKLCYDALRDEQKIIFLDVACLFFGMDGSSLIHLWEARGLFPEYEIRGLQRRSLIKTGEDGKLWMHDHLRDLGRYIVVQESGGELGSRSRLWNGGDAITLLQNKEGTEKVEAISLEWGATSGNHKFSADAFEKLSNLWFLALGDAGLCGDNFHQGIFPNLRWLSWHGSNLLQLPSDLHLEKLVVLDLSRSDITGDWDGWKFVKGAKQLAVLNLTSCHKLATTPDFSSFLHMKRLILEDCRGLTQVHPSIGKLTKLEFLDMRNCRSLKKLPDEFKLLEALTELLIDETPIRQLPITSQMKYLETLSAKSCKYLALDLQLVASLPELTKVIINQS